MEQEKQESPIIVKTTWAKAFSRIGVTAILIGGIIYIATQCMRTPGKIIEDIAKGFNSGKVVTEFRDYVTKIRGVNYLQVATLQSIDTFSRTDSKNIMWDWIGLPDVRIEIQAPVEYTFYLDLKDKWEFQWHHEDQSIIVIAPMLRPNTPAIDVSNMKIIKEEGSVLRNEEEVKEKLKQQITEISKRMAQEKIPLVRELARNETRQFLEAWFIKVQFKQSEIKPHIQMVYFADENELINQQISSDVEGKQ